MTLDLNFLILDLEGKEIPNANAGKIIADKLVGETKGDAFKFYDWGRELYNLRPITVDTSDLIKIREFVEKHNELPILTKAQILRKIEDCKAEEK